MIFEKGKKVKVVDDSNGHHISKNSSVIMDSFVNEHAFYSECGWFINYADCEEIEEEKPTQYQIGIDTFKRMEANCTLIEKLAFAKGNIDKYTWRNKGQDKADFEKIINYAQWALKQIENETKQNRTATYP